MSFDEPAWWYGPKEAARVRLLAPLSRIWQKVAERRWRRATPYQSARPVICIGNFTAGGTGKTPLAASICDVLRQLGRTPIVLTRGYGGKISGPHWVDPRRDTARDVGDEPLWHAERGPVVIARNRAEGAAFIEARGAASDVIVMDDGLQNPTLAKDLTIAVVDARRGLGNGHVMPAGPLRAGLEFQLDLVDAIVVVGAAGAPRSLDTVGEALRGRFDGPVLDASVVPVGPLDWLTQSPLVAWAGIANPRRFFDLLAANGATVAREISFPDHHMPSAAQAANLLHEARLHQAMLVTTRKDSVRVRGAPGDVGALGAASRTIDIGLAFADRDGERLTALLARALRAR